MSKKDWACNAEDAWIRASAELAMDVNYLRARSQKVHLSPHPKDVEVFGLMTEALEIDSKVANLLETLSSSCSRDTYENISILVYQYRTISVKPTSVGSHADLENTVVWPGNEQIYAYNHYVAPEHWNKTRLLRVYCHAVIIRCMWLWSARMSDLFDGSQHEESVEIIQKMVDDICATIPAMITPNLQDHLSSDLQERQQIKETLSPGNDVEPRYAIMMLFSLYVTSTIECISEEQRRWLKGRLKALAPNFGLMHALPACKARPCLISGKPPFPKTWETQVFRSSPPTK